MKIYATATDIGVRETLGELPVQEAQMKLILKQDKLTPVSELDFSNAPKSCRSICLQKSPFLKVDPSKFSTGLRKPIQHK